MNLETTKRKSEDKAADSVQNKPAPFADLRNAPIFVDEVNTVGAEMALTQPLHVPPGIRIYWATDPKRDDNGDVFTHYRKGYRFARLDEVTRDDAKARAEGLICLRHFEPDVFERITVRGAVLMVTSEDVVMNRLKAQWKKTTDDLSPQSIQDQFIVKSGTDVAVPTIERESRNDPISPIERIG